MTNLCELSAVELRRLIGAREVSPLEVLESCIRRIEDVDGAVNALPIRCLEEARGAARKAGDAVVRGEALGPLHGLPIAIKDLNHVRGLRTTFGSPLFLDYIAERDDLLVRYLRDAGAVIVGKTNTSEFGVGANTTNNVFGPTRNPFNPVLTAGGSSGGAAAALAVDMVPLCTGNDTGGSLRIPSSFCGTTALRPTQGAVPYERRLFAHSTFQTQGPMARSVEDTQLLFTVMARPHPIDPMSTVLQDEWPVMPDLSKLRVAVSADLGFAPTSPEIRTCFEKKVALFGTQFAACDWIVPPLGSAADVSWILRALQHVTQHKERYEAHRDRLGALVVRYFEEGLRVSVQDIGWAKAEQMRLHQLMADFLAQYDFLVCPCVAVPPFPVEELFPRDLDGLIPDAFIRWAGLTNGLAVLDSPIVAMPCGVDDAGMPFGIQVVSARGTDYRLLALCAQLQRAFASNTELQRPRPSIARLTEATAKPARAER